MIKRAGALLMAGLMLFGNAMAEVDYTFRDEALAACCEQGMRNRTFPSDITPEELIIEPFEIQGLGQRYTVWLVSTSRQRVDIEFGWFAYQTPAGEFQTDGRDWNSCAEMRSRLQLEVEYGCMWFWTAEQRAAYYRWLYGDDVSYTFPNENEISEPEAIECAKNALCTQLDLPMEQILEYGIQADFYHEKNEMAYTVNRYWGVTFRSSDPAEMFFPRYAVVVDGATGEWMNVLKYVGRYDVEDHPRSEYMLSELE